jgi:hypothetical protein
VELNERIVTDGVDRILVLPGSLCESWSRRRANLPPVWDEVARPWPGCHDSRKPPFHAAFYRDTALASSHPVLSMLRDVAGIDQVLYGTVFLYLHRDLAVRAKQRILQSSELNDSERCTILGGNASPLLPHLHSIVREM